MQMIDPKTGMPMPAYTEQKPQPYGTPGPQGGDGTSDATKQLVQALLQGQGANNGSGLMGVLAQMLKTFNASQMQGTSSPQDGRAPMNAGGGAY
jgi:hypothetical protein